MKTKYLIVAALCCIVMVACQGNAPDNKSWKGDKQSSEIVERLDGLVDSIGSIIDSKTLKDSTVVLTDDHGNTITKDKEGNITIVTKEGRIIIIDISINEDSTSAKDKWYNTKWKYTKSTSSLRPDYMFYDFLRHLRTCEFQIEERDYMSKDTIVTNIINCDTRNVFLRTTACSIQKNETQTEYTYHRTYNYVQYIVPQEDLYGRYRYSVNVSKNDSTYYYHTIYRADSGNSSIVAFYSSKDSVLIGPKDYINIDTQEKLLSRNDTTIFYNYRRLDDTQLAVFNNSESYIFKEITDRSKPYMSMCDMNGKQLIEFELISF